MFRGADFRKDFSELATLRSFFPNVPFMALTATASIDSINNIKKSLVMANCKVIRASPDRKNIFLVKQMRLDSIYSFRSYDEILLPIAKKLKECRKEYPQTLIYLKLRYCAYAYTLFTRIIGSIYEHENQSVKNCLIAQFHASQTDLMKNEIISELSKQESNIRVVFCTSALSMGINMPFITITRIIHISPPSSLEEYVQEIGRAGRSGLQSFAYLYYCNSDISDHMIKKGYITSAMVEYCKNNRCLRKCILNYFSFDNKKSLEDCCCIHCEPECPDKLTFSDVTNDFKRTINERNLIILTEKLNNFLAEKDSSFDCDDISDFLLNRVSGTEELSKSIVNILENISTIRDENDIIRYGITNSVDSKAIIELINKYSVINEIN